MTEHGPWDVIVVGGGVSGCMAALAAARQNAKTLLVECYGFLGGTLTNAGVGPMMTFHAGKRQVVTGIPQELIERLCALGGCMGHIEDTTNYASSVTPFDAEMLKLVLDDMMSESGVEVLLHVCVTGVEQTDNKLQAIHVHSCGGMLKLWGRVFIDATGDAMLSFLSGAGICQGREQDGLCQPMTLNLKLRNVDIEALKNDIRARPDNFNIRDLDSLKRSPRLSMAGFYEEFNLAKAAGELSTQREDVLLFETVHSGEVIVNTVRVIRLNPVDPWDLSYAEREGRKQAHELVRFFHKYCTGFEKSELVSTGVQIGVRESRRVIGDYTLTAQDLLQSKHFEDTVALGGYPIDIHNPNGANTETAQLKPGQYYFIPLRSMMVKGFENLMVCGRCISATHEAEAAVRVTPVAMAMGQAAGVVAALSAVKKIPLRQVDCSEIRTLLKTIGATVE